MRTLETLGVNLRQRFRISDYIGMTFWIDDGVLWQEEMGTTNITDSSVLMEIYDDPSLVMVGDVLTADQRSLLYCLSALMGVKWLAMDMNGIIGMFTDEPEKGLVAWYSDHGSKVWFEQFASDLVAWEDKEPFDSKYIYIDQREKKTGGIEHD